MNIDYQALNFSVSIIALLMSLWVGIYAWWRARALATQAAIERVEANADAQRKLIVAQVQGHEDRLLQIEERVAHLPRPYGLGRDLRAPGRH